MVEVRVATPQDREIVSRVLARAFVDDPVLRWMLPSTARDERVFRALATRVHAAPGWTDLAWDDGRPVGAALWDPPGHRLTGRQTVVGYAVFARAMGRGLWRGASMDAAFSKHRPPGDFWYLGQLGAVTQGRGIGSMLMEHRLARCDGASYLESSHPANLPFYERYGYEVVNEFTLPQNGPPVWGMLRPSPST